ncbi:hypothetical protein RI367_000784 [Sorochytrium milnesiophthora]
MPSKSLILLAVLSVFGVATVHGYPQGGDDSRCSNVGDQMCVYYGTDYGESFKTCLSNGYWSVLQDCGRGTMCDVNPANQNRVICKWASGH